MSDTFDHEFDAYSMSEGDDRGNDLAYEDWIEKHNKLKKCPECGAPMKTSLAKNKYCSKLCWIK